MKRIMIGNDINLKYSVFADQTPEDLSNLKEIKVWLRHETIKALQIEPVFTIVGNVISMDVHAGLHKRTGAYRLFIQYKKNNPSRTPDYDSKSIAQLAFTLVETTEEAGGESICPELEPITIELSGDVGFGSSPVGTGDVSVDGDSVILVNGKLKINVVDSDNYESIGYNSSTRPPSARQIKIIRELLKTDYVKKETGKGLSSNDYTTNEKNKLGGIEAEANKYTHPSSHPASMISEDESHRFVTDGEKQDWADKYSKVDVDNKISAVTSGLNWKPMVPTFDDLALLYPDAVDGWTATTVDPDNTYRFDGANWIPISANAIPKASQTVDGLMSKEDKTKLSGVAEGAEVNVTPDWNATEGKARILNKPDISTSIESAISPLRSKTNMIISTGEGNKYLADDGTYKSINASAYISTKEQIIGKFSIDDNDYDIYSSSYVLTGLSLNIGESVDYIISNEPLGFNVYTKATILSVCTGTRSAVSNFYNSNYKVDRIYVDNDLNTHIVLSCIALIGEEVNLKATVTLEYVKFTGNKLSFSINVPSGTDMSSITASIPNLKYNKKLAYSFTVDDNIPEAYKLFCTINQKWVDSAAYYHYKQTKTTGTTPLKKLSYTDGCGNEIPFKIGLAIWAFKTNQYIGELMNPSSAVDSTYPYIVWKDAVHMNDLGTNLYFHDVDAAYTGNAESISEGFNIGNQRAVTNIGHKITALCRPNGDDRYIAAANLNDDLLFCATEGINGQNLNFSSVLDLHKVQQYRRIVESLNTATILSYVSTAISSNNYSWVHHFSHVPSSSIYNAFVELNNLYGKDGDDSIWFTGISEIYDYWFLKTYSSIKKNTSGSKITFDIYVPEFPLLRNLDLSFMVSGISSFIILPKC